MVFCYGSLSTPMRMGTSHAVSDKSPSSVFWSWPWACQANLLCKVGARRAGHSLTRMAQAGPGTAMSTCVPPGTHPLVLRNVSTLAGLLRLCTLKQHVDLETPSPPGMATWARKVSSADFPATISVLKLKVPHPGNPISPGQTELSATLNEGWAF